MKRIRKFSLMASVLFIVLVFAVNVQARSVDEAVQWARDKIGSSSSTYFTFNEDGELIQTYCQRFVAHSYGNADGVFGSALLALNSTNGTLGDKITSDNFKQIPRGALVFFDYVPLYGHVGLCIGDGEMIHVWPGGIRKDNIYSHKEAFLGWRWPTSWTNDGFDMVPISCDDIRDNQGDAYEDLGLNGCVSAFYSVRDKKDIYFADVEVPCYSSGGQVLSPQPCLRWVEFETSNNQYDLIYDSNVYGLGGSSTSNDSSSGVSDPEPTEPDFDPDLHISRFHIKEDGASDYEHKVEKTLAWGQSFQVKGESRIRNESSQEAKDVDCDYRIEDNRDFDKHDTKIDEDNPFDIDPGEKVTKSMSAVTFKVSSDGNTLTVSLGSMSKDFPITKNFVKVYIFVDVKEEGREDGDRDISSESDTDEYGVVEVTVLDPPIVADFSAKQEVEMDGLAFFFTDNSTKPVDFWNWNFGDGVSSNEQNPVHFYDKPGMYVVTLTVANFNHISHKQMLIEVKKVGPDMDILNVYVSEPESGAEKLLVKVSNPREKFYIHVATINQGNQTAKDFKIKYYISNDLDFDKDKDEYIDSDRVDAVAPGEIHEDRKTRDSDGDYIRAPEKPGLYFVFARISSLDEDVESDNDFSCSDEMGLDSEFAIIDVR